MNIEKIFCGIPAPGTEDFEALVAFCEGNEPLVLACISYNAAELVSALGFRETIVMIRNSGGTRKYLSKEFINSVFVRNSKSLERLFLAAEKTFEVELPSATGFMDAVRRIAIGIEISRGESCLQVCRRYGISDRAVRKQLNTKGKPFLADAAAERAKTPAECFPGYGATVPRGASLSDTHPLQNPFNVDPIAEV